MNPFNKQFFASLGFNELETDVYEKNVNDTNLKFKVFETTEYGTNIEYWMNSRLYLSGYFYDENDFRSTF